MLSKQLYSIMLINQEIEHEFYQHRPFLGQLMVFEGEFSDFEAKFRIEKMVFALFDFPQ